MVWIATMGTQKILGCPGGLDPGLKAMSAPRMRVGPVYHPTMLNISASPSHTTTCATTLARL